MYLPLAVSVNGTDYLITDFNTKAEYAIRVQSANLAGAVSLSVNAYGADSITLTEWVALSEITDIGALSLPVKAHREFIAVVKAASGWPEKLLKYLDTKQIPWRTLYLLTLSDAEYAAGFAETNPSVQSFRQFVEAQRDFSVTGTYSPEHFKAATGRRSPDHIKADTLLAKLNKIVPAQNKDSFETPKLRFAFTVDSPESYHRMLEKFKEVEGNIDELYAFLKEKGLA